MKNLMVTVNTKNLIALLKKAEELSAELNEVLQEIDEFKLECSVIDRQEESRKGYTAIFDPRPESRVAHLHRGECAKRVDAF